MPKHGRRVVLYGLQDVVESFILFVLDQWANHIPQVNMLIDCLLELIICILPQQIRMGYLLIMSNRLTPKQV